MCLRQHRRAQQLLRLVGCYSTCSWVLQCQRWCRSGWTPAAEATTTDAASAACSLDFLVLHIQLLLQEGDGTVAAVPDRHPNPSSMYSTALV
jgi:hypothetical protein